ncbi:ATP-binding protein [Caldanaerobacter sp.]|uniref:sensor histidine kinase n=1 Tax=Caldanaerobacter sp. TaxID=2930036 RepID=UPI003C76A0EB
MPRRITFRIALLYSAVFSCVLIFLNASVLYTLKYYLIYQSMKQVTVQSEVIASKLDISAKDMSSIPKDMVFSGIADENIYVKIFDSKGNIVYQSKNLEEVYIPYAINLGVPVKIDEFDKDLVYLNTKFKKDNSIFYIQVVKDMKNEYAFLKLLFILMFFADGAGILISFVTGYLVTKRALKPVDYMIKEVKEIDAKRLSKRLKVYGKEDELVRLAKTFNDMLDRLEESFARQNRFVSDASHELRTPISIIKGYIDMLDRWGKEDKEILEEGIKAIKKQTLEMENLVEKLLFLARGDDRSIKLEKDTFDLKEMAEEVIAEIKLIYEDKDILLKGESVNIKADKRLIKELLRILVDNAAKYTLKDGRIEIEIGNSDRAYIKVRDNGIGIPEEELPHIFERFYRIDKARSKETGGTGLGLSIAKWIVEEHGGEIHVRSKVGEGSEFTVLFPIDNDSK